MMEIVITVILVLLATVLLTIEVALIPGFGVADRSTALRPCILGRGGSAQSTTIDALRGDMSSDRETLFLFEKEWRNRYGTRI